MGLTNESKALLFVHLRRDCARFQRTLGLRENNAPYTNYRQIIDKYDNKNL